MKLKKKGPRMANGCGSVAAVPQFKSSHQPKKLMIVFTVTCCIDVEKKKEAPNGP